MEEASKDLSAHLEDGMNEDSYQDKLLGCHLVRVSEIVPAMNMEETIQCHMHTMSLLGVYGGRGIYYQRIRAILFGKHTIIFRPPETSYVKLTC